ncbi:uncharacterized protein LOC121735638 [Aricia agestis]|uniref:uncharacterized protein LOC121735638 n=1 Tax=Aricia agestis TaxID=91739 RepID=UPI001C20775D|nr:uncharacterized protein LOC121735638 [Aricia agestis]
MSTFTRYLWHGLCSSDVWKPKTLQRQALSSLWGCVASQVLHISCILKCLGLEPLYESPNYEIAMFLKAGAVFFSGYMVASIKALNLILYGYTEAHLLAMAKELRGLWNDRNQFFPRKGKNKKDIFKIQERSINKYITQQLRDIAQLHIKNKDLINLLEANVRSARVVDITSITFAVIAELLAGLNNTFLQANFTMVALFIDCVVGQKIIDANEVFIKAIYGSKWENFDTSNKKTVLLILMNAQRVMRISAGGFMDLSFVSFATVIRFTYSTYTTLKSAIK